MATTKRTIVMSYHPALKRVKFEDAEGNDLSQRYSLERWTRMNFVLQEQGDDLFKDIAEACDSYRDIEITFDGTDVDYEDFTLMVDYYNEHNNGKTIKAIRGKKLPDMDVMLEMIKSFGCDVIERLTEIRGDISRSTDNSDKVNRRVNGILKKLNSSINDITDKMNKLDSNRVNICLIGTYSAGKSTLINSLIGEKILPMAEESKTAKFFMISSPEDDCVEKIRFKIDDLTTTVSWNGETLELDSNMGTHEMRTAIQEKIDENAKEIKSIQFYNLLDFINGYEEIGTKIELFYNFPIDSDSLHFTIYDTPGTDSNNHDHLAILRKAITNQENSIVVLVAAVRKLEGSGNSDVLALLCNDGNNRIDVDRSLFVINQADAVDDEDDLEVYKKETLKMTDDNNEDSSHYIKLEEKKLFFMSAAYAVAAMEWKHGLNVEKNRKKCRKYEPDKPFYEWNNYGKSALFAERMISNANNKLDECIEEYDKAYVRSGVYSLLCAIREYGEKYSIGVKVNALYSAIAEALDGLQEESLYIAETCENEARHRAADIDRIRTELEREIEYAMSSYTIKDSNLPRRTREKLQVDSDSVHSFVDGKIHQKSLEYLSGKRKLPKKPLKKIKKYVKLDKIDAEDLGTCIKDMVKEYSENTLNAGNEEIDRMINECVEAISKIVNNDEKLSSGAKRILTRDLRFDVDTEIKGVSFPREVKKIINEKSEKRAFGIQKVNTDEAMNDIEEEITKLIAEYVDKFCNDYRFTLNTAIEKIKHNYDNNVEIISDEINMLTTEKKILKSIAEDMSDTANELIVEKNDLDRTAWGKR